MARSPGTAGHNLLGASRTTGRPPNTNSLGRNLFVLMVLVLGALYAAPNLFQPDPALQIRATEDAYPVDEAAMERAVEALESADVPVAGFDFDGESGLIRVNTDEQQLRGRDLVAAALNPTDARRYVVALNRASTTPEWLRDIGGSPMSLGLDLSGGVHFLLEVDMEKFLGDRMERNEEAIRNLLVENRIRYVGRDWLQGRALEIGFQSGQGRDEARQLIADRFEDYAISERTVEGRPGLRLALTDEKVAELEDFAISQNLTSLRNRVNELGVSEPLVQRLGRARIVLDLPGVQDSARAKEIINKFANLEFRLVARDSARPGETETYQYEGAPVELEKTDIVTGNQVTNAVQDFDPETGQPQVSITLDNEGGQRMNDVTQDNVGNRMAIIFKELNVRTRTEMRDGEQVVVPYTVEDSRVINVATIQSALGFRFRITGLGLDEARDLALLLRAGALAAPMYIVEERTVGASLGEENIEQGRNSVIIGFALVLVFMLAYYKWFGLAADVALTANLVLILAIMSVLGATLTLPGIAGIVLTVGMAVDANVLIFSRIREEAQRSAPQAAIQTGFDRAVVTILDANITTFFVAIILFSIGSGPVKGFAVTLAVGIVTSMFTAIMVTRALVNLMYGGRNLERLAI
ncbi:MAG: protein translocase subunit SecD [Pseudomonadota bacterium]